MDSLEDAEEAAELLEDVWTVARPSAPPLDPLTGLVNAASEMALPTLEPTAEAMAARVDLGGVFAEGLGEEVGTAGAASDWSMAGSELPPLVVGGAPAGPGMETVDLGDGAAMPPLQPAMPPLVVGEPPTVPGMETVDLGDGAGVPPLQPPMPPFVVGEPPTAPGMETADLGDGAAMPPLQPAMPPLVVGEPPAAPGMATVDLAGEAGVPPLQQEVPPLVLGDAPAPPEMEPVDLGGGTETPPLQAEMPPQQGAVDADAAPQDGDELLGLAGMGDRPDPADRQMTREEWDEADSRARAEATLARLQPDQPLENPNVNAAQEGHGHGRHGSDTTDAQQADRVVTGRYPDQAPTEPPGGGPIGRASRFGSPQQEVEALMRGQAELDRRLALPAGDPEEVQGPFVDPMTNVPVRQPIVVDTNREDGYGTSQVVQRQPPPSNQILPDQAGNRVAVPSQTPLTEANMIYEFVPSTGEWRLVTYHPQPAVDPNTGQRPLR